MDDFENVKYRMEEEGFDYAFRCYSNFEDIKDEQFHVLREAYVEAAEQLERYVNEKAGD